MFKIHFVSLNKKWTDEMKKYFDKIPFCLVFCTDIRTIPTQGTVFVSPANSLGFMDGGIDRVLSEEIFPGCVKDVKEKISLVGLKTILGRPYLPVGSAVFVPYQNSALISAPTMFLPHDVSTTRNAYHAFMAALMCMKKYKNMNQDLNIYKTLVVTSLCCGIGKMDEGECAKQLYDAYMDFISENIEKELGFQDDPCVMLLPNRDDEQPNNYDNREIKHIDISHLVKSRGI